MAKRPHCLNVLPFTFRNVENFFNLDIPSRVGKGPDDSSGYAGRAGL